MRFDERARDYDRHAGPQAGVVERLASWIPEAPPGPVALELGAGTGLLTRKLLEKGYRVRATDSAPGMVAAGAAGTPGADWGLLDARFPEANSCDRIFSANLLQWIPDPVETFRRHRKALRPGGRVTHALFVEPTLGELREILPGVSPLTWHTGEFWLGAAAAAGFRVIRHEEISFRPVYPDALTLFREIHGTGAVSGKAMLSATRLRAALREYDRRFMTPGGVYAGWTALLLEAEPA